MKIKKLLNPLKRAIKWIGEQFHKDDAHKEYRSKIVVLVNAIKKVVEMPITEDIVKFTPWTLDDKIWMFLRKMTSGVLKDMGLAVSPVALTSIEQAAQIMRDVKKEERGGLYATIGGKLYESVTGLPLDIAIKEIQKEYKSSV